MIIKPKEIIQNTLALTVLLLVITGFIITHIDLGKNTPTQQKTK